MAHVGRQFLFIVKKKEEEGEEDKEKENMKKAIRVFLGLTFRS